METILIGLAVVPLAAFVLWFIYDRFSPRGIKRRRDHREAQERGAAARLDLFNKNPD